jgi:hypothetical protein
LTKNNNNCKIFIYAGDSNKVFDIDPIYESEFVFIHYEVNYLEDKLVYDKDYIHLRSKHHINKAGYACVKYRKGIEDKLWVFYENNIEIINTLEKHLRDTNGGDENDSIYSKPVLDLLKNNCEVDENLGGQYKSRYSSILLDKEKLWQIQKNKLLI